jgi:hypothetical protein
MNSVLDQQMVMEQEQVDVGAVYLELEGAGASPRDTKMIWGGLIFS